MTDVAVEKVLLAGISAYPDRFFEYLDFIDESDFSTPATRMTFEALNNLIVDKEIKRITKAKLVATAQALGHHNYLSCTRNGAWIDELLHEPVEESEISVHFLAVKRQSLIRGYIDSFTAMKKYLSGTSDDVSTIIGKVEDSVVSSADILDKGRNQIISLTKDMWGFIDGLSDDPGHIGLDVGFPVWQEKVGQLRNGSITFVVATAKAGKSQFALRVALETAYKRGLPVLLLDSELNERDQRIRLAGMMAQVPYQYVETGFWNLTVNELKARGVDDPQTIHDIQESGKRMRDRELRRRVEAMPISYQSIGGMDIPDVLPYVRRWLMTHVKPDRETTAAQCLIVYDYIKLGTLDEVRRGIAEWQQHGVNVNLLHTMMKEYNVPCLAFGQTNNELTDGFRCVAGGKRISENVTSISHLKKKNADERAFDGEGTHMVQVFGTRYGSGTSGSHINFDADLSIGQFHEIGMSTVNIERSGQEEEDD